MAHAACRKWVGSRKKIAAESLPGCDFSSGAASQLWEHWRWLSRLLFRSTDLRRLPVVPLERHPRRAYAELARRDLGEVVVTGFDTELHRVEWIGEADRDAHVVAIELFPQCDVGHLQRGEAALLDVHRCAIPVVRLERHRRVDLTRNVEPIGPGYRVRRESRLRAAIRHHLVDVEPSEAVESWSEAQGSVEIGAPRVGFVEVLEAYGRHLSPIDSVGGIDVHTNDIFGMTIEWRELQGAQRPRLAESELERISVLGIQVRIADENVLLIEENRERIELLRSGPPNAP